MCTPVAGRVAKLVLRSELTGLVLLLLYCFLLELAGKMLRKKPSELRGKLAKVKYGKEYYISCLQPRRKQLMR